MTFNEFGFEPGLLEGIMAMGYETATPIQEKAIPVILKGRDLIGSAQTGTGKTAAFLLPLIQEIINYGPGHQVKALIIVPTRELAIQIDQHMEGLSYFTHVSSIAVYGGTDGSSFMREKQSLTDGADIIVCTPGRMIAHINMGYVNFSGIRFLVLDEADRMLDMGFFDDIMKIISYLPANRQNLLFAATMPSEIRTLARKALKDPEEITLAISKPVEKILQLAYSVYDSQKIPLLKFLLQSMKLKSILVFCSTKSSTKQLSRELKNLGLPVEAIHSDLDQDTREKVLNDFKNKKLNILVATDILSRGIDVENIDMVINYDVPHDGEDYIHRIGRTARAEASGVAVTFINPKEQYKFQVIENLLDKVVHKATVPVQFGESPVYDPKKNRKRTDGRPRK
ncbi:MAG: DEAD/DEAH box helicase [Bacteroidetes bacterium]|nr:DEAD/DEAH box helicase [Bacteroidota bacterium]